MVLLKYFGKEMKEDWTREIDIVEGLSSSEDPQDNLLHYRWHSKGKWPSLLKIHLKFLPMCKKIHSFQRLSKKREKPKSTRKQEQLWLTNRFQVAVRLFSNRSQMTSKCGQNKKVAHEAHPSVSRWSYHILTSSVIYYTTDTRQLEIYFFYIINN